MLDEIKKQASEAIFNAIASDPDIKKAFEEMMAGGLSAVCAPFVGMGTP